MKLERPCRVQPKDMLTTQIKLRLLLISVQTQLDVLTIGLIAMDTAILASLDGSHMEAARTAMEQMKHFQIEARIKQTKSSLAE